MTASELHLNLNDGAIALLKPEVLVVVGHVQPVDVDELIAGGWDVSGLYDNVFLRWIRLSARRPSFVITPMTIVSAAAHVMRMRRAPEFLRDETPPKLARLIAMRCDASGGWERRAIVFFPDTRFVDRPGWYWHPMNLERPPIDDLVDRRELFAAMQRFQEPIARYPRTIEYPATPYSVILESLSPADRDHLSVLGTFYVNELLMFACRAALDRAATAGG